MLRKGEVCRWNGTIGNKHVQPGDIIVIGEEFNDRLIWATCIRTGFRGTTYINGDSMEVIGHAEGR